MQYILKEFSGQSTTTKKNLSLTQIPFNFKPFLFECCKIILTMKMLISRFSQNSKSIMKQQKIYLNQSRNIILKAENIESNKFLFK